MFQKPILSPMLEHIVPVPLCWSGPPQPSPPSPSLESMNLINLLQKKLPAREMITCRNENCQSAVVTT